MKNIWFGGFKIKLVGIPAQFESKCVDFPFSGMCAWLKLLIVSVNLPSNFTVLEAIQISLSKGYALSWLWYFLVENYKILKVSTELRCYFVTHQLDEEAPYFLLLLRHEFDHRFFHFALFRIKDCIFNWLFSVITVLAHHILYDFL